MKARVDTAAVLLDGTAMSQTIHVIRGELLEVNVPIVSHEHINTNVDSNCLAGFSRDRDHVLHKAIVELDKVSADVKTLHLVRLTGTRLKVNSSALSLEFTTTTRNETSELIKTILVFIHLSPT